MYTCSRWVPALLRASGLCWGRAVYTAEVSVPHLEVPGSHGPPSSCSLVLSGSRRCQKSKKKTWRKNRVVIFLSAGPPPIPKKPCENPRLSGIWPQLPFSPAADLGQVVPVLWASGFSSPKWKSLQGQAHEARVESTKELWGGRMCAWGREWQRPGNCWRHALIGSFASTL